MDDVLVVGAASVVAIVISVPLGLLPGAWALLGFSPLLLIAGAFVFVWQRSARRG